MVVRLVLGIFCALLPTVVFGQGSSYSIDKDGCISGRPCAFGVPLPPPDQGIYAVDKDGCVVGQPCPWRGWRTITPTSSTKETTDWRSGNVYQTKRNPDGTTDVFGSNRSTGSLWEQHIDPNANFQYGYNNRGQFWAAPLSAPASNGAIDWPPNVVFAPNEQWRTRLNFVPTPPLLKPSISPTGSANFETEQKIRDDYARRKQDEQRAIIGRIMSRMQDGSIVEVARAAARQRCLKLQDENARDACMRDADRK